MKVSYYDYIKKTNVSVLVAEAIFSHLNSTSKLVQLKEVADTTSGGTPLRSNPNYYNGNIPWLKSGELNDGLIESAEEFISEEGLKNSSAKIHPKGTLLIAMYGATAGKTGILNIEASTNQAVCAVFPKEKIERDYLFWFFRSHRFQFIEKSKGGAQPNISQTVILNTVLPIISKSKQLEIIELLNQIESENSIKNINIPHEFSDKVISVFNSKNKVEALSTELSHQLTLVKKLRQQLLQDAVQGKLVEQDPGDEPAGELLKRIKAEKQKLIKEGKLKKEKELPGIKEEEISFEVPEGWEWCRLGEITNIQRGSSPRPKGDIRYFSKEITDYNWITISDITSYCNNNILLKTKEHLTEEGTKYSRYVDVNEFIIAVSGSTTGKCCLTGIAGYIYDGLAVAKSITQGLDSSYLYNYMMCLYSIINNSKSGASFPNINTDYLNLLLIPLPPLSEQCRIVQKLEELMGMCEELESSIRESMEQNERLLQQVLREALRGVEKEKVVEKV